MPKLLAKNPDIVLMFGLAGRTPHVRIETRARNAVSVLVPDAGGQRPRHGAIMLGGPAALAAGGPFARLLGALREHLVQGRFGQHDVQWLTARS